MDASSPRYVPVYSAYPELLCCPFSEAVLSRVTCHRRMSRAAGECVCYLIQRREGGQEGGRRSISCLSSLLAPLLVLTLF